MWKDPIVEELRSAARQLELKAQGDVHQFFENLRKHQSKYEERIVRTLRRNTLTQPKR